MHNTKIKRRNLIINSKEKKIINLLKSRKKRVIFFILGFITLFFLYYYRNKIKLCPYAKYINGILITIIIILMSITIYGKNGRKIFIKNPLWQNDYTFLYQNENICQYVAIVTCIVLTILQYIYLKSTNWTELYIFSKSTIRTFIQVLVTAICEEFLFRVIIFNTFLKLSQNKSYFLSLTAIASSLLFAGCHVFNYLLVQDHTTTLLVATTQQIVVALGFGLFLSNLHIIQNGISLPIIFYFGFDFMKNYGKGQPVSDWRSIGWQLLIFGLLSLIAIMSGDMILINRKFEKECSSSVAV